MGGPDETIQVGWDITETPGQPNAIWGRSDCAPVAKTTSVAGKG